MDPFQARLTQRAMRNPYKDHGDSMPVRLKHAAGALAVLVFLFLVCAPAADVDASADARRSLRKVQLPPTPFTIMTFNLRFASAHDGYNSWDYRKDHLFDVINRYKPTIMGTQEGLKDQLAEIHANLVPNYQRFGVEREPNGEFEQIFYDADVLEMVEGDNYWLSDTPEVPHQTAWGAPCVRMVTWGRFRLKATQQQFIFVNTQFDHRSEESRLKSAALVWKRIQAFDPALPVFVVGDFNTYRHTSVYSYLTSAEGANLAEAWQVADHTIGDVSYTYHGWAGVDNDGEKVPEVVRAENHIDWILFRPRNLKVLTTEVITESRDGRYPSDHYPIQASLLLPNVDVIPVPKD